MNNFYGFVQGDVEEKMIQYWMSDEGITRDAAMNYYYNDEFLELCKRLKSVCEFKFDTESTCFEIKDNDFVIPVSIITEVPECYLKLKAENERILSAIKKHKGDRPRFNMVDFELYKESGLMDHLEEQGGEV